MISVQEAFKIAQKYSLFTLAPVAYDCFDRWFFIYGGPANGGIGFWPVAVRKKDGAVSSAMFEEAWNFRKKMKNLVSVPVNQSSVDTKRAT